MRFLVPAIVVLILVVGALIAYRMHNRNFDRRKENRQLKWQLRDARVALAAVRRELNLQITADHFDPFPFQIILADYDLALDQAEKKGITRK